VRFLPIEFSPFSLYYVSVIKMLETINSPQDLKNLPVSRLQVLADEIRSFILNSISRTGGHLASSLGVVELTVALHYVFDFSRDKLLWDVGHQCYAHKIITGRKDKFARIRQQDGLSGFPDPAESEYDQFAVGHAGTSIATALGMALGQEHHKSDEKIIALVGDASIVNGLSFEALNNLGFVDRQLLIVLNDNSMAIDATQGALAKYFSKIRLSQTYEDLRRTTNNILEHMPVIGKSVEEAIEKIKKSIRMVLPASQMFESLNIPYFGPVDGHDIASLVKLFEALANLNRPAILHVYTKKGKGFVPAENDKPRFHSTGPFKMNGDSAESDSALPKRSFTDVFGECLVELAKKDKRIVAITSAMRDGTGLSEFSKKFPDRFFDVGIAESAAVDIAAGMARTGSKPVVCIYSTFLQRSFDQIFQEVSLQNLPVVFCIDRAGFVGADGPTHHGLMDIGYLRMLPNVVLAAPANETEMKLALEYALATDRCVCIRYPRDLVPPAEFDRSACNKPFRTGKSVTVRKSKKSSAVIVSYGSMLYESLKAAEKLSAEGIKVDVINARFAAPIDEQILFSLQEGKSIITVEDHSVACGFGSAVLELAAAKTADFANKKTSAAKLSANQIRLLGVPARFIESGSRAKQFMQAGISADNIQEAVKQMITAAGSKKRKSTRKKVVTR